MMARSHLKATTLGWVALLATLLPLPSLADVASGLGPSLKFNLGSGIYLNEDSTLQQRWVIVNDPSLPVKIDTTGFEGLKLGYARDYFWRISAPLILNEKVSAIGLQVIPVDVWNDVSTPLGVTEIADIPAGKHDISGQWNILSENDAAELLSVVVFVRQVRLQDGTVLKADLDAVTAELVKLAPRAEKSQLTPAK